MIMIINKYVSFLPLYLKTVKNVICFYFKEPKPSKEGKVAKGTSSGATEPQGIYVCMYVQEYLIFLFLVTVIVQFKQ